MTEIELRIKAQDAARKAWEDGATQEWIPTYKESPPIGQTVRVMDSGGYVYLLVFEKSLWWFPDRSMYVYFTPKFWQYIS